MVWWWARELCSLAYWLGQYASGTLSRSERTRPIRAGRYSPVAGSRSTTSTLAPYARMMAAFCAVVRGSITQIRFSR